MNGLPMTVWKRTDEGTIQTVVIDLHADVLFVEQSKDFGLILHTREGQYYAFTELEQFEPAVSGYVKVETNHVVNMRNVKQFHPEQLKLTFEEFDDEPDQPYVPVAAICRGLTQHIQHS